MKKIYLLILFSLSIISCISDTDEINDINEKINELNSVVEIEGCTATMFNFDDVGNIEVLNDTEFLYITIHASSGYALSQVRLHIAQNFTDFPGNGNLPPGKMDFQESFPTHVESYTFQLLLSDYGSNGSKILIASYSSFTGKNSSYIPWAGDILVKKGNWQYFKYTIQECEPPCKIDAGESNSKILTRSEAGALPSWDEVRKLYLSLLDPGVSRLGIFDPSIDALIAGFQTQPIGDFTTKYTLTEGDCTDSVNLTLTVIPNE